MTNTELDFTAEQLAEIFQYLDELRESGQTNMFGAGAYLRSEFDMERRTAAAALSAWMNTFSHDEPVDERAAKALKP